MSREAPTNQDGFTLVELVIAISFTVMFTALVFSFMLSFWRASATLENDAETFVTRQNAGDKLRDVLNAATQLVSQNSISDTYPLAAADGTHWQLIHAIPSTINTPSSGGYSPVFYFESPSVNSSKNFIYNGASPYYDEFVLYLNGSTKQLLLRTLANPNATGNAKKTSCPASNASASCPADSIVADNVTAVSTRYFSRSGNTIDYTSITDPNTGNYIGPDFPAVEVVEITVHIGRKSTLNGGQDTSNETIVRVALRNG